MAFDRPMEADRVDDLGLLGSLIRFPVVGIMWLLGGGGHAKEATEEEAKRKRDDELERELSGESKDGRGRDGGDEIPGFDRRRDGPNGCRDRGKTEVDDDDPGVSSSAKSTSSEPVNRAEVKGEDKENEEPSPLHNRPPVGVLDCSDEDASKNGKSKHHNVDAAKSNTAGRPCSSGPSSRRESLSGDCPATQIIDDLATAMESNRISSASPGPASAVLSRSKTSSSSTNSLSASYSASSFSDHRNASRTPPPHSSVDDGVHLSRAGSKRMSWSDECGNRSLVEYSDDSAVPARSKHWSAMRRNSWRASRHSFDRGDEGAGTTKRNEIKVIKSALKRSGSYSPPVSLTRVTASTSSTTDSSRTSSSSSPDMRSFRSLSAIGSFDSSRCNSSDGSSKESVRSQDADDSMASTTNKKPNSNIVQYVPATLQVGCGRASGGLIIPRGGPNDPRYQLILGANTPAACGQETDAIRENGGEDEKSEAEDAANSKTPGSPNPAAALAGERGSSTSHHHNFLPHCHANGYISPQYGFYVNITPPPAELYAARKTLKSGNKPPRSAVQQQSYQQFQYQSKYRAPSAIPEGSPGGRREIHQRFAGSCSVPRPSSNRSAARQNSLKPTFTKNKKGMGMLLAENPSHGVWPTVPFG